MIKLKKLSAYIIAPLLLLGIGFTLLKINIFAIKDVEVNLDGVDCVSKEQITSDLNLVGKNIFAPKYQDAANKLKSKYFCVDTVIFEKNFPGKVQITLKNRIPIAKIGSLTAPTLNLQNMEASPSSSTALLNWDMQNTGKYYLIDKTGLVFSEKDTSLPVLYFSDQALNIGRQLDSQLFAKIGQIFENLGQMRVSNFESKIDGIDLLVKSQPRIVFALNSDLNRQIASLQLILQKAKIDSKTIEIIDLRFDKPVMMYTSKQTQNLKEEQATSSR